MKIHEVITRRNWIQHHEYLDGRHCAAGWIRKIYGEKDYIIAYSKLVDVVGPVREWNDAPERTFPEVLAAFKAADL